MKTTRRQVGKVLAALSGLGMTSEGAAADVDYGGQDLTSIASITFTDGTTQTTASTSSGGDGGESVADVILTAADTVSDMQTKLDAVGAGAAVYIESGDYTWDDNLFIHNGSTVHIHADTITFAEGVTGGMFESTLDPAEDIELVLHGVDADGNRSTLSAGDNNHFAYFSGANEFVDIHVNGVGELHDFRGQAVVYSKVQHGSISGFEAHHNGEPDDSSEGGDGAYVAVSYDVSVKNLYVHNNERHGVSFAGTGSDRNVACAAENITGHDNGNDTLNSEETENLQATGIESRNDGADGLHFKGTGTIEATVINCASGPLLNVQDFSGETATRTGETNKAHHLKADITSIDSQRNGIRIRGNAEASATVTGKVVDAALIGIYNEGDIGRLTIDSITVDGCGRYGIYAGNDAAATTIVNGGSIDGWDANSEGVAGVGAGNSLGDGCIVRGVRFGKPVNGSPPAVGLGEGDYHVVDGNAAPTGLAFHANGANSTVGPNAN